jgi:hypothetical protein
MARPFFALLSLSLLLSACTQRMICPAYQSAFVYDKDELRKKFSYFQEDSTPKILIASKTKFLIAEPTSYRKKLRALYTVAMKPVNPVLPDSLTIGQDEELTGEDGVVPGAELDLAARSVIDSTFIVDVPVDTTETSVDSVYVITKDKELRLLKYNTPDSLKYDETSGKHVSETPQYEVSDIRYNVEQDNYMWYLRNNLVLPDVRLSQMQQKAAKEAAGKAPKSTKKKKGFLGFFKNLFKKKAKEDSDTTELQTAPKPNADFDYIDEDSTQRQDTVRAEQPTEKKGPLSFLKKKNKTSPPEEEPAAVKEKPKKKKREKKPKDQAPPPQAEEIKIEEEKKPEEGF